MLFIQFLIVLLPAIIMVVLFSIFLVISFINLYLSTSYECVTEFISNVSNVDKRLSQSTGRFLD